ncbi:MAG: hypothetical protein EBV73_03895, partial [Rhodocyclales bacterium]|nr:hypothetical protein [Rhodocyclales bacterium]
NYMSYQYKHNFEEYSQGSEVKFPRHNQLYIKLMTDLNYTYISIRSNKKMLRPPHSCYNTQGN